MLGRLLLALPLLAVGPPVFAQTQLAQQCAAFGEAQYRKLSPSIDRVTALEFPPPALERVEAKAGSQAVNAALTLRGKLTFRNGPPFETHFVCLLDAQRRPLFFYALPALATRGAPTPVTRGGAPAPAPPPTDTPTLPLGQAPAVSEPTRPPLPASAVRLRGLVRDTGGRLQLLPCDGRAAHLGRSHAGAGTHPRAARADDGQGRPADVRRNLRQPRGRPGGGHRRVGAAPRIGRDGRLPRAVRPSRMDRHGQRSVPGEWK